MFDFQFDLQRIIAKRLPAMPSNCNGVIRQSSFDSLNDDVACGTNELSTKELRAKATVDSFMTHLASSEDARMRDRISSSDPANENSELFRASQPPNANRTMGESPSGSWISVKCTLREITRLSAQR